MFNLCNIFEWVVNMADFDLKNPTFDPDELRINDDAEDSFNIPDAPSDMVQPPDVQQELNTSGDRIQSLWGELGEAELDT